MQKTSGRDYLTPRDETCFTCKKFINRGDPCREITTQTGQKKDKKYYHLDESQCKFMQTSLKRKDSQNPKKKKIQKKFTRFI
jgi:hypothetical protein